MIVFGVTWLVFKNLKNVVLILFDTFFSDANFCKTVSEIGLKWRIYKYAEINPKLHAYKPC